MFLDCFAGEANNLLLFVDIINYKFDRRDIICLILCTGVGVWYLLKKVNNYCAT